MSVRNSLLVVTELRKLPSTAEVVIIEFCIGVRIAEAGRTLFAA